MTTPQREKQALRKLIRAEKKLHGSSENQTLSAAIIQKLLRHPRVCQASILMLYYALPDEVQTKPLLDALRDKTILLPVMVGDELTLRRYDGEKSIRYEPAYNIGEPAGPLFTDYDSITCAIIPGMAFDTKGHRLGRGKGYYDRLLPQLTNAYKIGVCYPYQLLSAVPTETHDTVMDEVISVQE